MIASLVPVLNTDGSPGMPVERARAKLWLQEGKAIIRKNNWGFDYIQLFDPTKAILSTARSVIPQPQEMISQCCIYSKKRRYITLNSRRGKRGIYSSQKIKISSSIFGTVGGILLASNTLMSEYGFIFLAASSSQLLFASILERDKVMILYSVALFSCVDLLGVYRWIIA